MPDYFEPKSWHGPGDRISLPDRKYRDTHPVWITVNGSNVVLSTEDAIEFANEILARAGSVGGGSGRSAFG